LREEVTRTPPERARSSSAIPTAMAIAPGGIE